MTTEQYWQRLDSLASAKGTDRLLEAAELLRSNPSLPLLISCHRANGRIQHLFTSFDERSPDATGNRYLICFTSEKQAKKKPAAPPVDEAHESGPDFSNLDERYGKRRKKGSTTTWRTEAGETARVHREGARLRQTQQSRGRPYLQSWRSEAQPRHSEVFVGVMRMDLNYIEMINRELKKLSEENLLKAWSYVYALSTLQRNEEEIKAIEYDLGIRRQEAENADIIDADVKRCTFCGKAMTKVRRLIAGPASIICSECVELCKEILDESDPPVDIHMPLKNLDFSRRALTALENAGYTEVGQMMELTESQMRNLPGVGDVIANNILATLKTVGVYLK